MRPLSSTPDGAQPGLYVQQADVSPVESRRRRLHALLIVLLVCALILILLLGIPVLVGVTGYVYYQMTGRIAPGVRVGDTSLGWMRVDQAAVVLHTDWNMQNELKVSDGRQSWSLSPVDLGLSLDSIRTARSAFDVARRQAMWTELSQMTSSWLDGRLVSPIVSVDQQKALAGLQMLDMQVKHPPNDAALGWDGSKLVVIPSELGYAINISQTLQTLQDEPDLVLASGYLKLPLMPIIPKIADVSTTLTQAEHFLDTPLTLHAYDPIGDEYLQWDVPREAIGSWLKFETSQDGPVVGIDEGKLGDYLEKLSDTMDSGRWLDQAKYMGGLAQAVEQGTPYLMMVSHRPTSYTVQPGDTLIKIGWKVGMPYWKILQANPDLNQDDVQVGQSLVIPSKDELLPLPVVPNKRIVIGIGEQRLWVYQDGQLLSKHVISTGIDRSPTQPGVFQVRTHEPEAYASVWDLYMPNFLGIYEAWPGFMNGIHGLPTLSNGRRLWANILGKPASYGCIIMNLDEAEWLYNWAEAGVVVEIKP